VAITHAAHGVDVVLGGSSEDEDLGPAAREARRRDSCIRPEQEVIMTVIKFARARAILIGVALAAPAGAQEAPPPSAPPPVVLVPVHGEHGLFGDSGYRSPGLAVALSLTPLPVDFGNLYAENVGWGIVYTGVEAALMVPMMVVAGRHMGHGSGNDWTDSDRAWMIGSVAGYVAVKLVAGIHAGTAAGAFNRAQARVPAVGLAPARGGGLLSWATSF
jgi:hypothetical protein